jgi:cobalamin biosynthesis protein CobD/CbiB
MTLSAILDVCACFIPFFLFTLTRVVISPFFYFILKGLVTCLSMRGSSSLLDDNAVHRTRHCIYDLTIL